MQAVRATTVWTRACAERFCASSTWNLVSYMVSGLTCGSRRGCCAGGVHGIVADSRRPELPPAGPWMPGPGASKFKREMCACTLANVNNNQSKSIAPFLAWVCTMDSLCVVCAFMIFRCAIFERNFSTNVKRKKV